MEQTSWRESNFRPNFRASAPRLAFFREVSVLIFLGGNVTVWLQIFVFYFPATRHSFYSTDYGAVFRWHMRGLSSKGQEKWREPCFKLYIIGIIYIHTIFRWHCFVVRQVLVRPLSLMSLLNMLDTMWWRWMQGKTVTKAIWLTCFLCKFMPCLASLASRPIFFLTSPFFD